MKTGELIKEVESRTQRSEGIRQAIDEYCQANFGIEDFSATIGEIFAGHDDFAICLGRQIPTISIEHLAKISLARWLTEQGLKTEAIPLAFTNDCFSGNNPLKCSYVRLPYLDRGRKGIFLENQKIVAKTERGDLDGRILAGIRTVTGETLPEFHYRLRQEVLLRYESIIDISSFFLQFLQRSIRYGRSLPQNVYINQGNYEKKVAMIALDGQILTRPPADWYYLFHLLMYVDGRRALLFTVGDDEYFQSLMQKAIAQVKEIIGFLPLIIDTPREAEAGGYKSHHLTEIPRWVFKNPNWIEKIGSPASNDCALFEAYEYFERRLIELV